MGINYVISDRSGRHAKQMITAEKKGSTMLVETWGRKSMLKSGQPCIDVRYERNAIALQALIKDGWKVQLDGVTYGAVSWAGEAVPEAETVCNVYIPQRDEEEYPVCIRPYFNSKTGEIHMTYSQRVKANIRPSEEAPLGPFVIKN